MKQLVLAMLCLVAGAGQTDARPLPPVLNKTLDGIPLTQALATIAMLGEWRLPSGGQIRLEQVMTRNGGECGVSDEDDANTCPRFTLFVSVNGESSVPVDFALFRLPETLGWKVPSGTEPENGFGKFVVPLSACEMTKTTKGFGWRGTSYLLHVTETLSDQGRFNFAVDLVKRPNSRPDCAD